MEKIETIFRAYDIRGVYGKELTTEIACDIGSAFATHLGYGKKVCLGKDTRVSGDVILESFLFGLRKSGCNAVRVGIIPIPVLGFLTWYRKYDAGVYISASHNPPEYNGIRFRGNDGAGYLDKDKKIKNVFMSKKFREVSDKERNRLYVANYDNKLLLEEYFEFVVKGINLEKDVSVVVDPGNGSAYEMLPLYEKIGCEVHGINIYPNGEFPGRGPDPNKKSLRYTSELLKNVRADFGVAFDADADRGIILDNKGRFVPPEKIAVIIAKNMDMKGKIVASTDCSILLEKELLDSGIKVVREKVGDVFISRAVKKYNAIIGVERSGHFFIPSFHISDDPFVMSTKLAEILSSTDDNLSKIVDRIPDYPYYSEYFRCCDDIKFDVMKKIKDKLLEKGHKLDLRDGIRIATDEWMVLIRASHTEPLIRMYIETSRDNLEELKKIYKKEIIKTIRENLGN